MASAALTEFTPRSDASADFKTTVVVVADVGSTAASWSDGTNCWLNTLLPTMLDRPMVLQYQCPSLTSGHVQFSWQSIYEAGDTLVDCLSKHAENLDFQQRALVFFCHGLGGLVVKRAIGVIYEQYHNVAFDRIIRVMAAIIFLGCPHPTFDNPQKWAKLRLILKQYQTIDKSAAERAGKNVAAVANISKAFDESNHDIHIISTFEGKPTRTKGALFKRHLLVDEQLTKTNSKREKTLKHDVHHGGLCNLTPGSGFHKELSQLLIMVKGFIPSVRPQLSAVANTETISAAPQSLPGWSISEQDDNKLAVPLNVPSSVSFANNQASSSDRSGYEMLPSQPIRDIEKIMKLPCFMMSPHPPLPEFCGREPILQLVESALSPLGQSSVEQLNTFAICGAGGLGKSQIAIKYAFDTKKRKLFDAIFWVPAGDENKLSNAFSSISVKLGLEDPANAGDQAVSRDFVLEWLSNPARRMSEGGIIPPDSKVATPRWLLIFDGADKVGLLRDYWPVGGKGSILITSRDPLAKTQSYIQSDVGIMLDPFSPQEAATLFKTLTGFTSPKDEHLVLEIAYRLSCFPLAVSQYSRTISRRGMSLREFLTHYEQDSTRLELAKTSISGSADEDEKRKTMATIWSLEDLPPSAAAIFNLISFFDPDYIPEFLLTSLIKKHDRATHIENYPTTLDEYTTARGEILASSLSQRNIEERILTTHTIIQDTNRLNLSAKSFQGSFQLAVEVLYHEWPFSEFDHNMKRWPKCEPLVSHVNCLERIYFSTGLLHQPMIVTAALARLLMDVGWYYVERGRLDLASPLLDHAQSVCDVAPTTTKVTMTDITYCRADIAQMEGDPQTALPLAIEYNLLASKHDPNGWRLPQSHNTLSAVYLGTGDFEAAIKHADLAIVGYESLPVPEFVDWPRINKAWAQSLSGRYELATEGLREYFRIRLRLEGPSGDLEEEPYKTAMAKSILGYILRHQKKYEDSITVLKEAKKQYIETVGEDHDDLAGVCASLGETYHEVGQDLLARDEYRQALAIRSKQRSGLAATCHAYFRLSHICLSLNDVGGAKEARKNGENIMELLGNDLTEDMVQGLLPAWART